MESGIPSYLPNLCSQYTPGKWYHLIKTKSAVLVLKEFWPFNGMRHKIRCIRKNRLASVIFWNMMEAPSCITVDMSLLKPIYCVSYLGNMAINIIFLIIWTCFLYVNTETGNYKVTTSKVGIISECQPWEFLINVNHLFYSIMKALAYNELQHSTITLHYILNLVSQLLRVRLVGSSHCKMRQTDIAGLTWITNFKIQILH